MYQVGDLIVYENAGVCQVMNLTASENCPALSCMPKGRLYYILHPLFGGGTLYTPADPPKAFMRPVISRREAEELISLIPKLKADPYYTQNLQDLREHYKAAASSHSCKDLIQLTMSVYKKKGDAIARGKRVGQVDQKYMRQAENQLQRTPAERGFHISSRRGLLCFSSVFTVSVCRLRPSYRTPPFGRTSACPPPPAAPLRCSFPAARSCPPQ